MTTLPDPNPDPDPNPNPRRSVAEALPAVENVESCITDRVKHALDIMKLNRDEQGKRDYRLALTICAPVKMAEGNRYGMGRKVADRLDVDRQSTPFLDAVEKRAEIDAAYVLQLEQGDELIDGMKCLCKHGEGTLTLGQGGACSVLLKGIDSASDHVSEFKSTGKGKGGGRIRRCIYMYLNFTEVAGLKPVRRSSRNGGTCRPPPKDTRWRLNPGDEQTIMDANW